MAKSAAITLAFLLAVFEIGACLRCYHCNTQQEPTCGDPFKSSTKYLLDCNSNESINYNTLYLRLLLAPDVIKHVENSPRSCHKITTETGTIVRTCLDVNPADLNHTCRIMDKDQNTHIKYCSVCDKDSCNGAGAISVSLPLATLALIITYLYCKQ